MIFFDLIEPALVWPKNMRFKFPPLPMTAAHHVPILLSSGAGGFLFMASKKIDWSKADFTKHTDDLALELGVRSTSVCRYRRKHGIPNPPHKSNHPDFTGQRFGRLLVLSKSPNRNGQPAYLCRCDCGVEKIIRSSQFFTNTRSCGCLSRENTSRRSITHGDSHSAVEYQIWNSMWNRCENAGNESYSRYGGRGIKVCERWLKYENFLADLGRRPSRIYSIERKNNDGDYCPENCQWATLKEQANNRSTNHPITIGGVTRNISEWATEAGLSHEALSWRINRGWPEEDLLGPVCVGRRH